MPVLVHISDLHRSLSDPIDNETLFASVRRDLNSFGSQHGLPDGLIVSGDLVQGVPLGTSSFEDQMAQQYEAAFDLVVRVCDAFLDGDRARVSIVPGNHDVCWNTSASAMTLVDPKDEPKDILRTLREDDSPYRWSWNDRRVYRVNDPSRHAARLDAYWDGVERFYDGVDLLLPIDRSRGFHLFEILDGRGVLAGFESTCQNDHLNYQGGLKRGAVARCYNALEDLDRTWEFVGSVWHHSISGGPTESDYLSIEAVQEMAGLGFQLGFHGHQHKAQRSELSISVDGGRTMSIVSSGSLCAGNSELPRGTDRQYNIVVLNEELTGGTLHVREMAEGSQFTARQSGRFLTGSVELTWSPRLNAGGRRVRSDESDVRNGIVAIDDAIRCGHAPDDRHIQRLIGSFATLGEQPRQLLAKVLRQSDRQNELVRLFNVPQTEAEAVYLAEAAVDLRDCDSLDRALSSGLLSAMEQEHFANQRFMILGA